MIKFYRAVGFAVVLILLLSGSGAAQWVQTNGPIGGGFHSFASRGSTLFLSSDEGVLVSTDNGDHWTLNNSGLSGSKIYGLAVAGSTIYAATEHSWICRSFNDGTTWSEWKTGMAGPPYAVPTGLVTVGDRFLAGTGGAGCFRFKGYTGPWEAASTGLNDSTNAIFTLLVRGAKVYAGTWYGLMVTSDTGTTWNRVAGLADTLNVTALAANETTIFAGTRNRGVYISNDEGVTWTPSVNGFSAGGVVCFTTAGNKVFAGTALGVFRSDDNGTTWTKTSDQISQINAIGACGSFLFASAPTGAYRSNDDGATWTQINHGLANSAVWSLLTAGSTVLAGTYYNGLYRSDDNGASWQPSGSGITDQSVMSLGAQGTNLFAGTNTKGLFASEDGGTTWTSRCDGFGDLCVMGLATIGDRFYAATMNAGVYLSTDAGLSWTSVNNGLTEIRMSALAAFDSVLLGSVYLKGIHVSHDFGANWTKATFDGASLYTVRTFAKCGPYLFASANPGGILRSADNGLTWTSVNGGVVHDPTGLTAVGNYLVVGLGMGGGAYFSSDYGEHWTTFAAGLKDAEIMALAANSTDVFLATWGGGVWSRPLSQLSCCDGRTGNVNMSGVVDLSDLSALVSYLTGGGYSLPCNETANVNAAGVVDVSDLSALVSYLTGGGYVLPNCP